MKIRNGFVSNSSSSSFIIGYNDDKIGSVFDSLFKTDSIEGRFDGYEEEDMVKIRASLKKLGYKHYLSIDVPYGTEELFKEFNIKEDDFCFVDEEKL